MNLQLLCMMQAMIFFIIMINSNNYYHAHTYTCILYGTFSVAGYKNLFFVLIHNEVFYPALVNIFS